MKPCVGNPIESNALFMALSGRGTGRKARPGAFGRTMQRLGEMNMWHFLWLAILLSEAATLVMNVIMSLAFYGRLNYELIFIGAVDAFVVPLVVAPIIIYLFYAERRKAEEEMRRSAGFLETIFESIRDPFMIIDRDFKIVRANKEYARMKGKGVEELEGRKCYEELYGRGDLCPACVVEKTFSSKDPCAKDKPVRLPDGSEAWMEIYTYPLFDPEGGVSHVIEYTRDVTERKRSEEERMRLIERLEYLSTTDSLTGLLNRRALIETLGREIDRAKRYGMDLSLILCDVDFLKGINDTFGHDAGDRCLKLMAGILKDAVRVSDMVGRHGGDEFMAILPETHINGAGELAERIRAGVEKADFIPSEGGKAVLTVSLGVSCFGGIEETTDSLIKRSDEALYESKRAGRNRVTLVEV